MHPIYIALIIWYLIPLVGLFAAVWWKAELIMGSRSSYWQERRDIMWIAKSLTVGALWPIAAVGLLLELKLRSNRERELAKMNRELIAELRTLKAIQP